MRNVFVILFAVLFIGCSGSNKSVRYGSEVYKAEDIFGGESPEFRIAVAAANGDLQEIKKQVDAGGNVNKAGKHDITPLWWAVAVRNYDGFEGLLKLGANPNFLRSDGDSVMTWAASAKDSRFLKAALKNGGDPKLSDKWQGPPIISAVRFDCKENVALLLSAGADINTQTSVGGETLPMLALPNYEMIDFLFQNGADPRLKDADGKTIHDSIKLTLINTDTNRPNEFRTKVLKFLEIK